MPGVFELEGLWPFLGRESVHRRCMYREGGLDRIGCSTAAVTKSERQASGGGRAYLQDVEQERIINDIDDVLVSGECDCTLCCSCGDPLQMPTPGAASLRCL